jgi:hypothetical protein
MHNMKISVTPWAAVRFLLFLFVMVGILLAPPAVSACTWLLLIAIPLVFWIKGGGMRRCRWATGRSTACSSSWRSS